MGLNCQEFTEEQVKDGQLQELVDFLMHYAYGDYNGDTFNDIHIRPTDCGSWAVEWKQMQWSGDENRGFEFIDSEHEVMLVRNFPDNTGGYFYDEEDYNAQLEDWLKENPGWKKDYNGHWYNVDEEAAMRKELGLDK